MGIVTRKCMWNSFQVLTPVPHPLSPPHTWIVYIFKQEKKSEKIKRPLTGLLSQVSIFAPINVSLKHPLVAPTTCPLLAG